MAVAVVKRGTAAADLEEPSPANGTEATAAVQQPARLGEMLLKVLNEILERADAAVSPKARDRIVCITCQPRKVQAAPGRGR